MNEPFVPPYENWRPYCLVCSTMDRMEPTEYGWMCRSCGNKIGKDLKHFDVRLSINSQVVRIGEIDLRALQLLPHEIPPGATHISLSFTVRHFDEALVTALQQCSDFGKVKDWFRHLRKKVNHAKTQKRKKKRGYR